jgi:hypothetical protein
MIVYKLNTTDVGAIQTVNQFVDGKQTLSIPFAPANSDYETFKTQINDDEAQLEDVDGNVMSPEAAKAYVATLPADAVN